MEPTSDTRSDTRFDPHLAAQLLMELAQEHSLEKLLQKIVERAMEGPHMACAQVWLIEKGDLCATCPHRSECPDQIPLPAPGGGESEIHPRAGEGIRTV